MEQTKKIVVVGGGIAGILSAYLYRRKGFEVVLIEKADSIGGLLRSQKLFDENLSFDYGTHFLKETGIQEVDKFLFEGLDKHIFSYLKNGSFFNELYDKNGFIAEETLPEADKKGFFQEFLKAKHLDGKSGNLEEQLVNLFGNGYAKHLIFPSVEKFFRTPPKALVIDSHKLFGLARIIISDKSQTEVLKNDESIDQVIAYHSYTEGLSSLKSFYPKKEGVGAWINLLHEKLLKEGVEIITSAEIADLSYENNSVSKVSIKGTVIPVERLVWTIPLFFLFKNLPIALKSLTPPRRLTSLIIHYAIEDKYLIDLYYFQVFDPKLKSFRVTLYDNFCDSPSDKNRITVELFIDEIPNAFDDLASEIYRELIVMGVVPENSTFKKYAHNIYPNSFPVLNNDFVKTSKEITEVALSKVSNLEVFGKANGKTWFMNDVFHDVYTKINGK